MRPAPTEEEAEQEEQERDTAAKPRVGFGRIIRDAEGNVIDIIIDEEPQPAQGAEEDEEMDGRAVAATTTIAGDAGEEEVVQAVEAKTDVVRCELPPPSSLSLSLCPSRLPSPGTRTPCPPCS